jgi:signal peptidase I
MTVARRLLASLAGLAIVVITAGLVLAWHQGYRIWVVHTGSMIPTLQPGEAIVDQPVRGRPHRGEIITSRYASGPDQVVTHRVYRESGGTIRTKGDANPPRTHGRCGRPRWWGSPPPSSRTGATSSCT